MTTPIPPVEPSGPRPTYQPEPSRGEAIREALKAGVAVAVAPQLFPTPPCLATRMVEEARIEDGDVVLEPSAGTGNILRALAEHPVRYQAVAVEIDPALAARVKDATRVVCGDFLASTVEALGIFDRILMNPPFANGDDIRHIKHAATFLAPGGRLVAICAGGPRQERDLRPLVSHWERLPEGTFKESGTNVSTVLLVIDATEGP